jgi:hypothetical protein
VNTGKVRCRESEAAVDSQHPNPPQDLFVKNFTKSVFGRKIHVESGFLGFRSGIQPSHNPSSLSRKTKIFHTWGDTSIFYTERGGFEEEEQE